MGERLSSVFHLVFHGPLGSYVTVFQCALLSHLHVLADDAVLDVASVTNLRVVHDHRVDYLHVVADDALCSKNGSLHAAFVPYLDVVAKQTSRPNGRFGTFLRGLPYQVTGREHVGELHGCQVLANFSIRFNRVCLGAVTVRRDDVNRTEALLLLLVLFDRFVKVSMRHLSNQLLYFLEGKLARSVSVLLALLRIELLNIIVAVPAVVLGSNHACLHTVSIRVQPCLVFS
mmetsp:Transcript_11744/g.22003  ORF Transcript_11744/g.22003 Transcript_11744/m.22003 type:complete len:230 (-) Transcript_11744:316-1005(-)